MMIILELPWHACVMCYKICKLAYYTYYMTKSAYKFIDNIRTKNVKYVTNNKDS